MTKYSQGAETELASLRPGKIISLAGTMVSLALIVGIGVWGYKLVMRDVTGIPVVRAMEGPMRAAPTEPGGEVAPYIGLAVNEIPAVGVAAASEDTVYLAPPSVEPSEADLTVEPTVEVAGTAEGVIADPPSFDEASPAEPGVVAATPTAAPVAEEPSSGAMVEVDPEIAPEGATADAAQAAPSDDPLTADQILALADQIAAGIPAMEQAVLEETARVETSINGVSTEDIADIVPASVPGVSRSVRPSVRPATMAAPVAASATTPDATASSEVVASARVVDPNEIAIGTNLVQLGAFDSAEIAQSEWSRISGRFSDYMSDKAPVIQQATRGGRTFFRLRAMGFADIGDARRFCAALIAQNTDCVPVVVR